MCGILCYIHAGDSSGISPNSEYDISQWCSLESTIANRGPDSLVDISRLLNEKWRGKFIASVLWMQGFEFVRQPCIDDDGNVLLWNGDIFSGALAIDGVCDTLTLSGTLKCNNILETINSIEGPFSIIYFHKASQLLYFARDRIGRHSLLMKMNHENPSLTLCSVAHKNIKNVTEVPAIGIFVVDLRSCDISMTCHLWSRLDSSTKSLLEKFQQRIQQDITMDPLSLNPLLSQNSSEPSPDELSYLDNLLEPTNFEETMCNLLKNIEVYERVTNLSRVLKTSMKTRLETMPQFCRDCVRKVVQNGMEVKCVHSKIGILFSGGLDSTILARIADELLPNNENIDLINVAFEKATASDSGNIEKSSKALQFDVPDRITGRRALQELQKICPNRTWNFIEVDVSRAELLSCCSDRICNLIYPLRTILDESLGCAVWFASRGSGFISASKEFYESPSRVLLLGMGADELFGGYLRHRTTLRRHGWAALTEELDMELSRISERNLGRDDRMVADHGRQARLPYLDENVIQYVQSLKPWHRCYPTERFPPGLGDKLLLRLLAYEIGLHDTAKCPKRAFQFGSRIANSKQCANDLSLWLQ